MADRVYLHIGAPKSGTTFVQTVMWTNQQELRDAGVLLPGQRRSDHNSAAVWARSPEPSRYTEPIWRRVVTEIHRWEGPAILSSEWFTMVHPPLVERFLAELAPSEVHVVFTARNLVRTVPAAWQERLKLGDSLDVDDFVATLDSTDNVRWNWGTLDASNVLPRWTPHIPPERMHVVTVPPRASDPQLLWRRFAEACGIPGDVCSLESAFPNESISAESARLLELVGSDLRTAVDADTVGGYLPYRWIRDYLSHRVLAGMPGSRIALRPEDLASIHERSERIVAALRSGEFDVVGDLDDLVGGKVPDNAVRPSLVPDEDVLEVAVGVIPELLGELRRVSERAAEQAAEVGRLEEELARVSAGGAGDSDAPTAPPTGAPARPRRLRRLAGRVARRLPGPVRRRLDRFRHRHVNSTSEVHTA